MQKQRMILLKRVQYGESDLLIHGLNTQGALVSMIARGALRSRKRFAGGVLEPTNYIEAHFSGRQKKKEGLLTLSEAKIIKTFDRLRTDLERLHLAFYFIKLVMKVSQIGELHGGALFNLLGNALSATEKCEHFETLRIHFEAKFLYHQGVLEPNAENTPLLKRSLLETSQTKTLGSQLQKDLNYTLKEYLGIQ